MTTPLPRFLLSYPQVEIQASPTDEATWYEFSATIAGLHFKELGGQNVRLFIEQIEGALSNMTGTPLKEDAAFASEINDNNATYLGCAVLSGYNTIYFFRHGDDSIHLILANSTGQVLAHTNASADLRITWLQSISFWSKENAQ